MGVGYAWVDVDADPEANDYIARLNNGKRVIPTIVLADGDVLANPEASSDSRRHRTQLQR